MPIFDQGYQHWQGPLSGHAWRWLVIARHGIRVQMKNRILRLLMLSAWLPALALVCFVAVWGLVEQKNQTVMPLIGGILPAEVLRDPIAFRATVWTLAYSYFFQFEMYFIMLLVIIAGPGLISRDLRFNALPLYLSRPMTRLDYFAGKLGVVAALVGAVAVVPAVLAYIVGVCFSLDLTVVKDTYSVLDGSVAYGLVITLSVGTLILALSSLTRRSLYVSITWAGLWIISGSVATILAGIQRESLRHEFDEERVAEANREDWRPLFSYVGNLSRMADVLLDTDAAWVKIGKAVAAPPPVPRGHWPGHPPEVPRSDERRLADLMVAQYPWWWSAAVLTGLLGISTWTLTRRVKSLDRLK